MLAIPCRAWTFEETKSQNRAPLLPSLLGWEERQTDPPVGHSCRACLHIWPVWCSALTPFHQGVFGKTCSPRHTADPLRGIFMICFYFQCLVVESNVGGVRYNTFHQLKMNLEAHSDGLFLCFLCNNSVVNINRHSFTQIWFKVLGNLAVRNKDTSADISHLLIYRHQHLQQPINENFFKFRRKEETRETPLTTLCVLQLPCWQPLFGQNKNE